ncbi:PREDICTED: UPF0764 protein C16orf89 homolog isoform X2 [Vollenhovia emeryi]|nr:PREDICTED: UPF0764 protein C16orf89 homolog isoform X2 [Vollenhovia emeryi]
MNDRPEQMNVDAIYGVTLAEANLVAALLHENVQYLENKFFIALKELVALSDLTRQNLKATVKSTNKTRILMSLNNPHLWIRPLPWTRILPGSNSRLYPKRSLSLDKVVSSIWHGAPNEPEGDKCITAILSSSLKGKCEIPATCIAILKKKDDIVGYPLTHRLLIVQIARAMECEQVKTASLLPWIPVYCAKVLQDLVNLEAWGFPITAQDLMLEQIVLCGMEGYCEFVDKHYEDIILTWPHQSGCFGIHSFRFANGHKVTRRESSRTDFGCTNHMTGLGAGTLALFIRENIENALVSGCACDVVHNVQTLKDD